MVRVEPQSVRCIHDIMVADAVCDGAIDDETASRYWHMDNNTARMLARAVAERMRQSMEGDDHQLDIETTRGMTIGEIEDLCEREIVRELVKRDLVPTAHETRRALDVDGIVPTLDDVREANAGEAQQTRTVLGHQGPEGRWPEDVAKGRGRAR